MRAVFAREGRVFEPESVVHIEWIFPDRPLSSEIAAVLRVGYLRGADLWHVANARCAARAAPGPAFITLDGRQQAVAAADMGFPI